MSLHVGALACWRESSAEAALPQDKDHQDDGGNGGAVQAKAAVPRGAVLLVLDSTMQTLPWESVPGLHLQRYVFSYWARANMPCKDHAPCAWRCLFLPIVASFPLR